MAHRFECIPIAPLINKAIKYDVFQDFTPIGLVATQPVVDKVRAALNATLQSPEFRKKMEASGNVVSSPSSDMGSFLKTEVAQYQGIVDFAKIEE